MRRSLVLLGALVVPVLPAAPAAAATNTICVNTTNPACVGSPLTTIGAGLAAAAGDGQESEVLVGPGVYTESSLLAIGDPSPLTVTGAGQGVTFLAPPPGGQEIDLTVNHATVQGLTVTMATTTPDNDQGISAYNHAVLDHVTVDGSGTVNTVGVHLSQSVLSDAIVLMPLTGGTRAVYSEGSSSITDSSLTGSEGVAQSAPSLTDTLSRVTIRASVSGVVTDGGTVTIDDALIDLGTATNATGLRAENGNASTTPKTIDAEHVTIVGSGSNSRGVAAVAANSTVVQTSTVNLTNSVVRGPQTSLAASTNPGMAGSIATVNVSWSDYTTTNAVSGPNGATAAVNIGPGNVVDVDPGFVSATDYHLQMTSPLVDKGNPASGGPATDRDGLGRVVDGDGNGSAVRDMGAYEVQDVTAPDTVITSGPSGTTSDATPTFAFTSEPGATFECRVDAAAYASCTSPLTTPPLTDGAHAFSVRAKDNAGNTDATPAARTFTVDTRAPETTVTKKPPKRVTRTKVKVVFSSEAGARFECRVDEKAWKPCVSPLKVRLKLGRHTLLVRATDAAGNVEGTPARVRVRRVPG